MAEAWVPCLFGILSMGSYNSKHVNKLYMKYFNDLTSEDLNVLYHVKRNKKVIRLVAQLLCKCK